MAKVITSIVGNFDNKIPEIEWPEGWPIPRVGDEVYSKNNDLLFVRHVCWYPHGEFGNEPFIYIVLWQKPTGYKDN